MEAKNIAVAKLANRSKFSLSTSGSSGEAPPRGVSPLVRPIALKVKNLGKKANMVLGLEWYVIIGVYFRSSRPDLKLFMPQAPQMDC